MASCMIWGRFRSDRHGERSEAGWPPVGVGRGRAAAVAKGPLGPEAAQAVCKRIRDAVKPFAQGSWRTGVQRLSPSGRRKGDLDVPFRILSTATLRVLIRPGRAVGSLCNGVG